MALTLGRGPLSATPSAAVNYEIVGPGHRLFFQDFPRRVRTVFGGEVVADTREGKLLHETGSIPQLYIPEKDLRTELLVPSEHTTVCPYKGEAVYRSVRAGDRTAENAAWSYTGPEWMRGYTALAWEAMDAWYDEAEEIHGHLRDPYHRVDVRASNRRVRVRLDGRIVADTARPMVLSETGLPNRMYIPPEDVRMELLEPSSTRTVCPYKGEAVYWSLRAGDERLEDVAWSYPQPLENALKAAGYLCFAHDRLTIEELPR
ncbi:DUF427 domain-containing protein [Thermostaphylospora chromogena]|uniref:Uncharacterized conserved protein, DUF427 family n=1 Tax=Thermostaphylospora chromogena TaxID=35622 RepID=A0A1H1H7W5_9ACTN|nr:DUF427 domain-containing protein [Thermostaphylospora chromogena]SDR21547.1 Uncharacterized conserved protein, DUF427 family [Thermostaphylospora chromogena]